MVVLTFPQWMSMSGLRDTNTNIRRQVALIASRTRIYSQNWII